MPTGLCQYGQTERSVEPIGKFSQLDIEAKTEDNINALKDALVQAAKKAIKPFPEDIIKEAIGSKTPGR